jgi:hypothetical protein
MAFGGTSKIGTADFLGVNRPQAERGRESNDWDGVSSISDVTIAPPYSWEP